MRPIEWTDADGYMRHRLVKDTDPDSLRDKGIPLEPPDINQLDWSAVRRNLHNQLMARGITTYKDIQRAQNGITAAVRAALAQPLIQLFREEEKARR